MYGWYEYTNLHKSLSNFNIGRVELIKWKKMRRSFIFNFPFSFLTQEAGIVITDSLSFFSLGFFFFPLRKRSYSLGSLSTRVCVWPEVGPLLYSVTQFN